MRFSDLSKDQVITTRAYTMTEAEILAFARQYDPQWFHVDAERARAGRWKGLIASGWHTGAVAMRLAVEDILEGSEAFGAPGLDHLRWLAPVRPGDVLRLRARVVDKRVSASARTGAIDWYWTVVTADDQPVLELTATTLFELQPKPVD